MKRLLLVTCVGGWLVAPPARAQLVVACPSCTQEFTSLLYQAKDLLNAARQIAQGAQQIAQLYETYQAFTGVRSIGGALGAMSLLGIQNPMPVDVYAAQNLISGAGGPVGMLGSIGALYTGNRSVNTVYTPGGNDWFTQQLIANGNGLAGIQALAQRAYQAASDRLQQLVGLRSRLATASDPKDVLDVQAHISAAQSDAQAQMLQSQQLQTLAMIQPRVLQQRQDEYEQQAICRYVNYLRGNEDGVARTMDCTSVAPSAAAVAGGYGAGGLIQPAAFRPVSPGGVAALDQMLAQPWGQAAANNAQSMGVNPEALAATCAIESNCRDVAGSGTVQGPFQMTSATQSADMQQAIAAHPELANGGQSVAASQELLNNARQLQGAGIQNPTVRDARAAYQWGPGSALALVSAPDGQAMASVLSNYSPDVLARNGISPGTTVGQWRQSVANKLGASANARILLPSA